MDTTYGQNNTLRIPMPVTKRSDGPLRPIVAFARKIGGAVASLHINLGRKTTILPGMSDKAIARFSMGENHEETMRWNALARLYGGTRTRI